MFNVLIAVKYLKLNILIGEGIESTALKNVKQRMIQEGIRLMSAKCVESRSAITNFKKVNTALEDVISKQDLGLKYDEIAT